MRLVVPHFGARPTYLALVLRSMAHNPDVHWLILTDEPVPGAPPNVEIRLCRFADLTTRIQGHFDFAISLEQPYKICDYRPAFGEIFTDELAGYDFWGHTDLDVIFGRIHDHLPAAAFEADKILFQGNFALYRNTVEAARWYRHEVGQISYREVMTRPDARHFDEWGGIYYLVEDLGVRSWHEDRIFDLSFHQYRTRAESAVGRTPRRYAWEDGEICEYTVERRQLVRRTALLIHLQKRTMRPPEGDVLAADRYWILPNGFAVQGRVTPWSVRAARVPRGRELVPFYGRRIQRAVRRRRARKSGTVND